MQIAGRVLLDPTSQTSATSTGPTDIKTVTPPAGSDACAFTVESPPIRVTFDGKRPTPTHGLLLRSGDHFFPFAKRMKFVSVEQGRSSIVNFLWLRERPHGHGGGKR